MPNNVTSNTNDLWADNKEYIILFTGIVALYIATNKLVEIYILENIVDYILRYIPAEKWYNDILFIFSIILITIMTYNNRSKLYYLNRTYIYLYAATVVYLINRFSSNWEFHSTSLLNYLYYSDILIFASIATIILLIKTQLNNPEQTDLFQNENGLGFITDRPIINIEDDKLQYSNYADNIAKRILDTNAYNSFAIGINGKWGTGKTSFFNLIKKKLSEQNKDYIEIDFSPWNTENPKAMMTDFFETFEEELSKYHSNVSKTVSNYSKKLTSLNEIDTIKPFTSVFSSFFSNPTTLVEFKCDLEKTIRSINKKIIVYIDDLDRLDNSEIIEVLRLIRNTANFKNTFFIVAYDKNYVTNALTTYNSYNKEGFLEKIFQLEINLPLFDKEKLRLSLLQNLKTAFPNKADVFQFFLFDKILSGFQENMHTMRDVVLISNSIIVNYQGLQGNVDFRDFLRLEILRTKFPDIYEILKNKDPQFVKINPENKDYYSLTKSTSDSKHLFELLDGKNISLDISIINRKKIQIILSSLFSQRNATFLSMINISKYENYFSYRLLEKTLDENEFLKTIETSYDLAKRNITIWINKGYEFDLLKRFYAYNRFKNFEEFKKITKLIFYLANHKSYKNLSSIIGFDLNNLYSKISITTTDNVDDQRKFIMEIILKAEPPFSFESKFIQFCKNHDNFEQKYEILSSNNIDTLSIGLLKLYIKANSKVNKSILDILHSNLKELLPFDTFPKYNKSFTEIVIEYLNNQSVDDLIILFINHKENDMTKIEPQIMAFFDNKTVLIDFLKNHNKFSESKYYREFFDFTTSLRDSNSSFQFRFKEIIL